MQDKRQEKRGVIFLVIGVNKDEREKKKENIDVIATEELNKVFLVDGFNTLLLREEEHLRLHREQRIHLR